MKAEARMRFRFLHFPAQQTIVDGDLQTLRAP